MPGHTAQTDLGLIKAAAVSKVKVKWAMQAQEQA